MRISKAIVVLVSGLSLAGVASAQEQAAVSGQKETGLKAILPTSYGNLEMRHSTLRSLDEENKVVNDVPSLAARPTLGATFFDGSLDSAFTWVFRKKPDTTVVERYYLMNITQWKAIDGKYGNIGPYAETYQKNGQSFDESYLGLYGELNKDLEIAGGKLAFNGYSQPVGLFRDQHTASAEANQVEPRNETSQDSLSLSAEGDATIEQRDPSIFHFYGANAKFSPEAVKGFSVKASIDLLNRYDPKYVAKETSDGEARTELDGYKVSGLTLNRLILGYKLTDKVTINNQFRQYIGGIYGKSIDTTHPDETQQVGSYRWENRLQVIATLF